MFKKRQKITILNAVTRKSIFTVRRAVWDIHKDGNNLYGHAHINKQWYFVMFDEAKDTWYGEKWI